MSGDEVLGIIIGMIIFFIVIVAFVNPPMAVAGIAVLAGVAGAAGGGSR